MPKLNLKPNHKAIRDYYATLQQYAQQGITHEGAVSSPFDTPLPVCKVDPNASPSTLTTKTARTDKKTSPTGH